MYAAQTGTGKTLAYTLPLIHQLKQQELESEVVLTRPNRPRALIIVPNRELALQVLDDALKPFHYQVPLKFFSLYSGQSHSIETRKLREGVDCLVSTLDRLQYRRDGDKLFVSNLSSLVIDELDTFLDAGKEDLLCKLIDQHLTDGARKNIDKQLIMCTATISKRMERMARRFFAVEDPSFRIIVEKNTHMNLSNLKHEFI